MTWRGRRGTVVARLLLGALVAFAAGTAVGPAPRAEAHAFLVRTVPAQGERLDATPATVSLEFSEPIGARGARLELVVEGRRELLTTEREPNDRVLRGDVASDGDGVYEVSWSVVAEDGHRTAGELAFGVGVAAGEIPSARDETPAPRPARVAGGLLFFAGLALVAGTLAATWTRASGSRPGVLALGLGLAQVGALTAWADALIADEPARQRVALAAAAAAVAMAWPLARLELRRSLAVVVVGAGVAWSARGHSAVANGLPGLVADSIHLIAGATWAGALVVLVIDVLHRDGGEVLSLMRRYARLAATLVAVLAGAGVLSAVLLLGRLSDLWRTGYGQTLLVKTGLVAGALVLAAIGRRALGRRQVTRLRRITPVEAGLLGAVLLVTAVLVNVAPPADTTVAGATLLGPPPLAGPVVRDAGLAGHLTVAITASDDRLRIEVFTPEGDPPEDAEVEVEATLADGDGMTLVPRPCGPGCFTQRSRMPEGTTRLEIEASASDWAGGTYVAELAMPPQPSDPLLVSDLVTDMRNVPAVEFTESTSSGPGSRGGPATFTLTGSEFVELEPWAAGVADDVVRLQGERGFRMYLPGDRIWITAWLDDRGRLVRERIVDIGHEINREAFRYPNQ